MQEKNIRNFFKLNNQHIDIQIFFYSFKFIEKEKNIKYNISRLF